MKKLLRALAGAAIIFIGLMAGKALIGMKKERPVFSPPKAIKLVKSMEVGLSTESPVTYIQGRARALDRMELFAEVNGVVLKQGKEFRKGVRFNAGELLLVLDAEEAELGLVAQRSSFLQLLTGSLSDLKVDFPERYEAWRSYTSEVDVQDRLPELPEPQSDREKFFLSNRGIYNQYYTIRSSEERLDKYRLYAPFSGEVLSSNVNQGSLVRAGQKIGDFVGLRGFEIESALSRESLGVVKQGDSVSFTSQEGELQLAGRVSRIGSSIDPNTQSATVYCTVEHPDMRDGLYLSGVIHSQALEGVTRLPLELLVEGEKVFAIEGDSLLRLVEVEVRHRSSKEVLVSGLAEGSSILAEPVANAFDGMPISLDRP